MAKSSHFCIKLDTLMPRLGVSPKRRSLRLGEPEPKFFEFSGPPRRSNSPPRSSIASPRRTCKSCFGSSFPLILTIFHWTNEDHNK